MRPAIHRLSYLLIIRALKQQYPNPKILFQTFFCIVILFDAWVLESVHLDSLRHFLWPEPILWAGNDDKPSQHTVLPESCSISSTVPNRSAAEKRLLPISNESLQTSMLAMEQDSRKPTKVENSVSDAPADEIDPNAVVGSPAENDAASEESATTPAKEANIVDRVHGDVTQRVVSAAQWFDSFFDDERYLEEENRTTLRLRFDTFFEEYENPDINVRARLDLKIPALEDKVRFTITGDPDSEPSLDDRDDDILQQESEDDQQRNVSLSAQYFFLDTLKRNASTRVGLTFRSLTPVAFGELRYRAEDNFGIATTRFIPRVRWWTDRGWEVRSDFDIEAPVMDRFFFRATVAGRWREDRDGIAYNFRYRLFQNIDVKRALEYEWVNEFETEPTHRLTEVTYRVRYRQQFWREWLFFEVAPQVSQPEKHDYKYVPGILFRLEVRFDKENAFKAALDRRD